MNAYKDIVEGDWLISLSTTESNGVYRGYYSVNAVHVATDENRLATTEVREDFTTEGEACAAAQGAAMEYVKRMNGFMARSPVETYREDD